MKFYWNIFVLILKNCLKEIWFSSLSLNFFIINLNFFFLYMNFIILTINTITQSRASYTNIETFTIFFNTTSFWTITTSWMKKLFVRLNLRIFRFKSYWIFFKGFFNDKISYFLTWLIVITIFTLTINSTNLSFCKTLTIKF